MMFYNLQKEYNRLNATFTMASLIFAHHRPSPASYQKLIKMDQTLCSMENIAKVWYN